MNYDNLMIRGEVPGGYNLAVGEPVFLQETLGIIPQWYLTPPDTRYPPFQGLPELQEAIKEYHDGEYKHIVITIGAKQAISAALYALKMSRTVETVYHSIPYWPTFPTLIKMQGLSYTSGVADATIGTLINNPDGAVQKTGVDILDCAYASCTYGWWEHDEKPWHLMSCWSAAKLLGVSGLRIGWLATNEPDLARLAAEYVEKATSGVATSDQYALLGLFRSPIFTAEDDPLYRARMKLLKNAAIYCNYLDKYITEDHGAYKDVHGMFGWFRPKRPQSFKFALEKSNVKMIPGIACGMDGFYRVSLGTTEDYLSAALKSLVTVLEQP